MILDDLGVMIIDKFFKPCKKCLVRATCKPFEVNCDEWKKFINQRERAESIGDNAETWAILISVILGMLLVAATFGLGIVKWSEMFF